MNDNLKRWADDLASLVARALAKFRDQVDDEVEIVAIDCSPWNGGIGLALLTTTEVLEDPRCADVNEMASWKYYDFTASLAPPTWDVDFGSSMRVEYEAAEDHAKVADLYFRACAVAMSRKVVQDALAGYRRSSNFKISVSHPDSNREYYPPTN